MRPHLRAGLLDVYPRQRCSYPPRANGSVLPDVLGILEGPPLDPGPLSHPAESLVVLPGVIEEIALRS